MSDPGRDTEDRARIVERPAPAEAGAAVADALARGHAVAVVGRCAFEDRGTDPDGDPGGGRAHHVLVKPDGTVVVHGGSGADPLRRIPPGGTVDARVCGDRLCLTAGAGARSTRIAVDRIEVVADLALDGADATVTEGEPSEADWTTDGHARPKPDRHGDLRERLVAEPDLVEPGFRPLSTERETAAGPVDLFGRDAEGRAVVVEVKAHRVGPAAVGQLDRYVSALRRDLHADAAVRGVLVAPSATERARALLEDRGFGFREVAPDGDQ